MAGFVLDNFDPRWLWYIAGGIGLLAVLGFLTLQRRMEKNEEIEASSVAVRETL